MSSALISGGSEHVNRQYCQAEFAWQHHWGQDIAKWTHLEDRKNHPRLPALHRGQTAGRCGLQGSSYDVRTLLLANVLKRHGKQIKKEIYTSVWRNIQPTSKKMTERFHLTVTLKLQKTKKSEPWIMGRDFSVDRIKLTHIDAGVMIHRSSGHEQSVKSWSMPKLCPISWATVDPTGPGNRLWSYKTMPIIPSPKHYSTIKRSSSSWS